MSDSYVVVRVWKSMIDKQEYRSLSGIIMGFFGKKPTLGPAGHVSLEIVVNNKSEYVSLYPGGLGKTAKLIALDHAKNKETGIGYNEPPHETIILTSLDVQKMADHWNTIRSKPMYYNLLVNGTKAESSCHTCVSLVWELLHVGGIGKSVQHHHVSFPTPNNTSALVKYCKKNELEKEGVADNVVLTDMEKSPFTLSVTAPAPR